jgi:YVTN family beta-propeller protein
MKMMKKVIVSLPSLVLLMFLSSTPLMADSILTTIKVGPEPANIAANPFTNKIYFAIDQTGEVAVVDGKTQKVTARINIGRFAVAVAVNLITNRVYASGCDETACNIWVINGRTDTVMTKIPIGTGSGLGIQGLAVNPITNRVYATDADNQQYIVINGRNNHIITEVPVFTQPSRIAVNPKTNRIYIGGGGFPGVFMIFDGETNAQLARIPESSSVIGVAVNFRRNLAYGTLEESNQLAVVDGENRQRRVDKTGLFPSGVDVNLQNGRVYVTNAQGHSVTIIDGKTNRVLQTLTLPAVFPTGVAVNLATGLIYVSDFESDQVFVLKPDQSHSDDDGENRAVLPEL